MNLLWLLILGAGAVTLGDSPVPSGMVVHSEHRTRIDLDLQARAGQTQRAVPLFKEHVQHSTVQVLASSDRPSRLRVAWQHNHQRERGPDGGKDFDLPVAGQAYTTQHSSAGWAVADGDGTEEQRRIASEASDLFDLLRGIRQMLPADSQPGDQVPAGDLFAGLVRDAPGEVTVSGTLTLMAVRAVDGAECALWDLRLTLQSSGRLMERLEADVSAELAGVLAVDVATGWTRRLDVAGEVSLHGTAQRMGQRVTVQGSGPFLSSTRLEFRPGG